MTSGASYANLQSNRYREREQKRRQREREGINTFNRGSDEEGRVIACGMPEEDAPMKRRGDTVMTGEKLVNQALTQGGGLAGLRIRSKTNPKPKQLSPEEKKRKAEAMVKEQENRQMAREKPRLLKKFSERTLKEYSRLRLRARMHKQQIRETERERRQTLVEAQGAGELPGLNDHESSRWRASERDDAPELEECKATGPKKRETTEACKRKKKKQDKSACCKEGSLGKNIQEKNAT